VAREGLRGNVELDVELRQLGYDVGAGRALDEAVVDRERLTRFVHEPGLQL
jgi:hypothetical protein